MPAVIWDVRPPAGGLGPGVLLWLGWATVLAGTFMINHFDLFGLRQVYLTWRGKPSTDLGFRAPLLYRAWSATRSCWVSSPPSGPASTMTAGHLLFANGGTAYILIAIQFEEHDVVVALGTRYRRYLRDVAMLMAWPRRRAPQRQAESGGHT